MQLIKVTLVIYKGTQCYVEVLDLTRGEELCPDIECKTLKEGRRAAARQCRKHGIKSFEEKRTWYAKEIA